jgi:transposase InsO family protein
MPGTEISDLCRRYGISRKTAYKWLKRHQADGVEGLADRSRRPHDHPRTTPLAMVERVLEVRAVYGWGGRKIHAYLVQQGVADVPAASTITAILGRHGTQNPMTQLAPPPARWQRFEAERPNDLWQIDFKAPVPVQDGTRHPLLILDDHSRFVVGLTASPNHQHDTVVAALTALFQRYGLPARLLGDNGSPWGTSHHGTGVPLTRLTAWLIRLGIAISHGRPYHPQTQGKIERCFRTLGGEVLSRTATLSPDQLQDRFEDWRLVYNHWRPHDALGGACPSSRYQASARLFPAEPPPLLYELSDTLVRVSAQGFIRLEKQRYFVSQAIPGDPVAVRPTAEPDIVAIWYGPQFVSFVDLREPT